MLGFAVCCPSWSCCFEDHILLHKEVLTEIDLVALI